MKENTAIEALVEARREHQQVEIPGFFPVSSIKVAV